MILDYWQRKSAMNFSRKKAQKAQNRDSLLRVLSLFAANPWKRLSRNHLHTTRSFCGQISGQTQSNPVKPSQTIFLSHFGFTATAIALRQPYESLFPASNGPLPRHIF
jgi:hypothetical protein